MKCEVVKCEDECVKCEDVHKMCGCEGVKCDVKCDALTVCGCEK